ncbi:uncharacterized protein LOC143033232 [Oratosquilla oratoria]|uniref:uncharacterized protein LOC143033232 n=1 Tax=Oratosquilla oratoria TaxID=337810 RepID=UPI003F75C251
MTLKSVLLFLLLAQTILVSSGHISQEMEEEEEVMDVDEGTNMTIQCKGRDGIVKNPNNTYWTHDHTWFGPKKEHVLPDGSLQLLQVTRQFSGHYKCLQKPNHLVKDVRLIVRGPPPPPTRVSVRPATVLAVVAFHYDMPEEQEQDPVKLHLVYRPIHSEDWHLLPHHISPTQKEVDVFKLEPNTTYEFCLWANNSYGPSSNVTVIATTLHEMTEIELARQLLEVSQGFTPKAWIVAVLVSLVVINVFVGVMAVLYCRYYKTHTAGKDDPERIELVPHIIENPAYQVDQPLAVAGPSSADGSSSLRRSPQSPPALV